MASENARQVAKKVLETVGKGQKVNLGKIIKEVGYSESVSESPTKVTETMSFQNEMSPFIEKMIKERNRILQAMEEKDLTKVQYQHLAEVADKFTKNIQLLGGKPTENNKLEISWQ